jgi:hypothetical protein
VRSPDPGTVEIVGLLVSPIHRYAGRPTDGPLPEPPGELVETITLRAGLGIVGDRYFGLTAHRNASITVMAAENLPPGANLSQTRRNVLLRGLDIDALVGTDVTLDSGDRPVTLRLHRPANPCAWMDEVIGPGSMTALRGKGGVRAEPLTDGTLRLGLVRVAISSPLGWQHDPATRKA